MKKSTWKRLFTRNKSKNRELNTVLCDMCVGMPLTDVASLCDRHRHTEGPKSQGILKVFKAKASKGEPETSVESKKTSESREESQPAVTSPSSPVVDESAVEPAVVQDGADAGSEKPIKPEDIQLVPQIVPTPPEENDSLVERSPEIVEIRNDAESAVEKPPQNPEKQDGAGTNEEFMTEEVDSPSLSENSRTENTLPIVIEPPENPSKELVREDSQLKRRISFTSLLPTKVFEIPSKEEQKQAEKMAAAENGVEDQENEPNKYLLLGMKKQKKRLTNEEKNAAITMANKNWFGTEQPGKSAEENNQEYDECDDESEDEEVEGYEEYEDMEDSGVANECADEDWNDKTKGQSVHKNEELVTHKEDSCIQDMPLRINNSATTNPTLSEPTPLSSLLPNVFLNAPKTVMEYPSANTQSGQSTIANADNKEDSVEVAKKLGRTPEDKAGSSELNSQATEEQTTDEPFVTETGNQEKDDKGVTTVVPVEHQTTTTMLDLTYEASRTPFAHQAGHIDDRPITNIEDNPGTKSTVVTSPPSSELPEADHATTRMVFGTIATEFTNQPLFFSPNFGAQRMGTNIDVHTGHENVPGEEQFPHYNIYDVMRNFLKTAQSSEDNVGRVTEITDTVQFGQENTKQQHQQQQLEDAESGQSPPSLEVEEEFDQNPGNKNVPEEQKELKKE